MSVLKRFSFLSILALAFGQGCITSPPGDHHTATVHALEDKLGPCPAGLIDDGEDNNNQIAPNGDRNGYWFTFQDEIGSEVWPKGDFHMSEGGAENSRHAAMMKAKMAPAGDSTYVGMGVNFLNPKIPYDASFAKGISFWAKGPGRIRVEVMDVNTSPEGDRCTDCYNHFGADLYTKDYWLRFTLPFDKLTQQPGWGDRAPKITSSSIYGIQWMFRTAGKSAIVWVDTIEFVGCESGS